MKHFTLALALTLTLTLTLTPPSYASVAFLPEKEVVAQDTLISQIEHYLSNIKSMKAQFTQTAPDGSIATGIFFLKRPGKMRWQYAPPSPILLVSNGDTMTFYDKELEQVSYVSLDDTMIGFLAEEKIRFDDEVGITEIEHKDSFISLSVAQRKKPDEGSLRFEFTDSPLQLRKLVITDATNQETTVGLYNTNFGVDLDDSVFVFKDPRKNRRN